MTVSLWNKYDVSRKSPEVHVKRSPKVARKERALALNAPWDSTAIGWKICELVRLVYTSLLNDWQRRPLRRWQTEQETTDIIIIISIIIKKAITIHELLGNTGWVVFRSYIYM